MDRSRRLFQQTPSSYRPSISKSISIHLVSGERILGDREFVDQVLKIAEEQRQQKHLLISKVHNLEVIAKRASSAMNLNSAEIWKTGKGP